MAKMAEVFDDVRHEPDFGNGRYVRNLIEQSKMNLAHRLLTMDPEKLDREKLTTLTDADIAAPKTVKKGQAKIGFCS